MTFAVLGVGAKLLILRRSLRLYMVRSRVFLAFDPLYPILGDRFSDGGYDTHDSFTINPYGNQFLGAYIVNPVIWCHRCHVQVKKFFFP